MPSRRVTAKTLIKIVKRKKGDFEAYAFGAYLERTTGYAIDELRIKAVHDRLALSQQFLRDAKALLGRVPSHNRSAVSRAYYSLYHTARALAFYVHKGDDFEKHDVLPGQLPGDFPEQALWRNNLKVMRLNRNEADYDPYPKGDAVHEVNAREAVRLAEKFLPLAQTYLRKKGCRL